MRGESEPAMPSRGRAQGRGDEGGSGRSRGPRRQEAERASRASEAETRMAAAERRPEPPSFPRSVQGTAMNRRLGKLKAAELERLILPRLGARRDEVLVGPRAG